MTGGAIAVGAVSAVMLVMAAGPPQQPVFRASVDVVRVDVQVVDADGRPIEGLEAADFDVRIDGRRRAVLSVDYVPRAADAGPLRTRSDGGPAARNVWPADAEGSGRTFVLAIDAVSLDAGDGVATVRAATAFLDRLPPADAVGLVTLPRGPSLAPTTDRVALAQVLARVSGTRGLRHNPFHLTPSEAADIVAEMDRATLARTAGGRGASLFTPVVLRQVQARECPGTADQACAQGIVIDADAQVRQTEDDVAESLAGLRALLGVLAGQPGRKTVVLMSGGMPVSDRSGGWHSDGSEVRNLGRAAAVAQATVYAVHIDRLTQAGQTAQARVMRPSISIARDRELQQRLLASFAATAGGTLLEAPLDAGTTAFERILLETSAHYTLGVAPEARDLDGHTHELRVTVPDRRLILRHTRYVQLRLRP
jgi:VWFA-related protein